MVPTDIDPGLPVAVAPSGLPEAVVGPLCMKEITRPLEYPKFCSEPGRYVNRW
jgi:hypothetical protein